VTLPRLMLAGTAEERRLLRAARHEGPSSKFREHVLLSIGVAGCIASGTVPSRAAGMSNSAHGSAATSGSLASGGFAVLVKWVGVAGIALTAGTGAGFAAATAWAEKVSPPKLSSQSERGLAVPPLAPNYAAMPIAAQLPTEPVAQAAATLPLPPPRVPLASSTHGQRDAVAPALAVADEVRLIDEARVAMRSGNSTKCLQLMTERRQRFPNGVLSPEASLLRIEALSASGQSEQAKQEGSRFLSQYPPGPLAGRVRVLLGRQASGTSATSDVGLEAM